MALKTHIARTVKACTQSLGVTQLMTKLSRSNQIIAIHMVSRSDAERFEHTVSFLNEQFKLVSLDEFISQLASSSSRKPTGLATLTFDDGFLNHYEVAYPILKGLSIPATFFVCSGLINSGAYVWTWEIGARLARLAPADRQSLFKRPDVSDIKLLVNQMKRLQLQERERLQMEIIAHTSGFQFSAAEEELYATMTWDHVTSLDASLITIGSHTHTHINLPQACDERLHLELHEGRRQLEDRLGRRVVHFCYPDGLYDQRTLAAVASYYMSAVTSKRGANRWGHNVFELNRIHIEYDIPYFAWDIMSNSIK